MKKCRLVWILYVICFLVMCMPAEVYAEEKNQSSMEKQLQIYAEEIDCEEIQQVMEEILEDNAFDFAQAVENAVAGKTVFSKEVLVSAVRKAVQEAFRVEKSMITRIMVIAVAGTVFVNFSDVFKGGQVADTGFFVTYLLLFSVMSVSFYSMSQTASYALSNLLKFMQALLPAYFVAVTFAAGTATSFAFYEISMVLVAVVEVLLVKLVLPMIHIYFVLRLINYISKEDYLSKAAELLEMLIGWSLKSLLGAAVGYNFIQGMILPAVDHLKSSMLLKTAKLIPGVGNAAGTVAEGLLGAGVVVKNAVGAVGFAVIVLIMAAPMFKIGVYCILYKLGAAILQPVSDKRMLECMEGAGKGAMQLLKLVFTGSALFLLTIAIVMLSTNQAV